MSAKKSQLKHKAKDCELLLVQLYAPRENRRTLGALRDNVLKAARSQRAEGDPRDFQRYAGRWQNVKSAPNRITPTSCVATRQPE